MDNILKRFLDKLRIKNVTEYETATLDVCRYDKENETMFITLHLQKPFSFAAISELISASNRLEEEGVFVSSLNFIYDNDFSPIELDKFINDLAWSKNYKVDEIPHYSIEEESVCFHFDSSYMFTFNKDLLDDLSDMLSLSESSYKVMNHIETDDSKLAFLQEERTTLIEEQVKEQYREQQKIRLTREKNNGYDVCTIDDVVHYTNVEIIGEIVEVESRLTKAQKLICTFVLYDTTNSIEICVIESKKFPREFINDLNIGKRINVRGKLELSDFSKQLQIRPDTITFEEIPPLEVESIEGKPRVELHLHTKMSSMDGVSTFRDYCARAASYNMKAIGVTDHGVVQAFPEVQSATKEFNLKPLYGVELYVYDDKLEYAYNPQKILLKSAPFVVLDLETTGLSARYDRIIEFGAVKFEHGIIVDEIDILINPDMKLSEITTSLTGITDEMVKDCVGIKEALLQIKEFIGDDIIVTHNATFDYGFLCEAFRNNNLGELNNGVIDTLAFSHYFFPGSSRHSLGALCRNLEVEYDEESAHRAIYDAKVLNEVWQAMQTMLVNANNNIMHCDLNELTNEDLYKHMRTKHLTLYAKNAQGLKDLFEIVSLSHTEYLSGIPKTPRRLITAKRENFIIGSSCAEGEIFQAAMNSSEAMLAKKMMFYDYIEIFPPTNYDFLINKGEISSLDHIHRILKDIISCAQKCKKKIIASGDVHYATPKEKVFRDVYVFSKGVKNTRHPLNPYSREKQKKYANPDQHFRSTSEMIAAFSFLNDPTLVNEIVIENTNFIADSCEYLKPLKDKLYTPTIKDCDKELIAMVYQTAHQWYGEVLPQIVEDRLKAELKGITDNNYFVIYYIASKIVTKTRKDGYLVGSRGSVGSSFVATMAAITEVNPLPPHYRCDKCKYVEWVDEHKFKSGYDLPELVCPVCGAPLTRDGQNIPFATFLGFNAEKVPDIDLNFPGDYQWRAHEMTKDLLGAENVFRAGTISTVAEKTAYGYALGYYEHCGFDTDNIRKCEIRRLARGCQDVKRTTGEHPGGIIVIPRGMSVYDFTAIQYPANDPTSAWKTTHFDFHAIHDNVLKLDLLGHVDPMALKMMSDITGIDLNTIPLNESGVISLFSSVKALKLKENFFNEKNGALAIPEFGTSFVRRMLNETKPQSFADLLIISGLSHGTDVWNGNAQELVNSKICSLQNVIGCRDDIMIDLHLNWGIDSSAAFKIMECVRKGKGLTIEQETLMRDNKVPDYYIESCKKIKYLFPKAHAVAYVMMAIRVGWFKVYRPLAFYATFFSVRCDRHDLVTMISGAKAIKNKLIAFNAQHEKNEKLENKELEIEKNLYIAYEMWDRGFSIKPVDLYLSDATKFIVDDENKCIIAPFTSLDGLGEAAALTVLEARKHGKFSSIKDLVGKTKLNVQNIDNLKIIHTLDSLPEDDQMTLDLF